jgi:hypothetical protein
VTGAPRDTSEIGPGARPLGEKSIRSANAAPNYGRAPHLSASPEPTFWRARTWTMTTRRSCCTRSRATTSSCPGNSNGSSSTMCARRRRANDTPESCSLPVGSHALRKTAAADPASRRLAVSVLRHDVESGSSPPTVSQPLQTMQKKTDHAGHRLPRHRAPPQNVAAGSEFRVPIPVPSLGEPGVQQRLENCSECGR